MHVSYSHFFYWSPFLFTSLLIYAFFLLFLYLTFSPTYENLFIQQSTECLLCAKHCAGCGMYRHYSSTVFICPLRGDKWKHRIEILCYFPASEAFRGKIGATQKGMVNSTPFVEKRKKKDFLYVFVEEVIKLSFLSFLVLPKHKHFKRLPHPFFAQELCFPLNKIYQPHTMLDTRQDTR